MAACPGGAADPVGHPEPLTKGAAPTSCPKYRATPLPTGLVVAIGRYLAAIVVKNYPRRPAHSRG